MRTCELCGDTLDDAELCIIPECPYREAAKAGTLDRRNGRPLDSAPDTGRRVAAPAPPPVLAPRLGASRARRFAASGPELLLFFSLELVGVALVPLGMLSSLLAAIYFAVRDQGGGRLSLGKRIADVRVVDAETGEAASPRQALLRNLPVVLGFALALVPGIEFLGWVLLLGWTAIEALLALLSPDGRRLGDRLAGTRVIDGPPEA